MVSLTTRLADTGYRADQPARADGANVLVLLAAEVQYKPVIDTSDTIPLQTVQVLRTGWYTCSRATVAAVLPAMTSETGMP